MLNKAASSTIFWFFGMTRPGIVGISAVLLQKVKLGSIKSLRTQVED